MSNKVRCLAVRQPWAWAIVAGAKTIENRSWSTDYRGPIVIQASTTKAAVNQLARSATPRLPPLPVAYSALIGVVDLLDVVPMSEQLEENPWAWGPYCWRLGNARAFAEPIPAKGKLNLYSLGDELVPPVQAALATARPLHIDGDGSAWVGAMSRMADEQERLDGLFSSYLAVEDGANALRVAERIFAIRPSADAHINRGIALGLTEEFDAALVALNAGLALDPDNVRAYAVRALVYDQLGEDELAERDRARVAELEPEAGGASEEQEEGE